MTNPERDYDEILRRALHAAVDPVTPSGDGLSEIRRRLAGPWLLRQVRLLLTECLDLTWLILVHAGPAVSQARAGLAAAGAAGLDRARAWAAHLPPPGPLSSRLPGLHALRRRIPRLTRYDAVHRATPGDGQPPSRMPPGMARLRPTLRVAAAVLIVVGSVYAVSQFRGTVNDIGLITGSGVNPPSLPVPPSHGHGRHTHRHGHRRHPATVPSPVLYPSSPSPSPSCIAIVSTTPAPRPSATVTPSPSATPTVTPSPSASPTDTPTPGPGTGSTLATTATAGSSPAGTRTPSPAHSSAASITGTATAASAHHRRRCERPLASASAGGS